MQELGVRSGVRQLTGWFMTAFVSVIVLLLVVGLLLISFFDTCESVTLQAVIEPSDYSIERPTRVESLTVCLLRMAMQLQKVRSW